MIDLLSCGPASMESGAVAGEMKDASAEHDTDLSNCFPCSPSSNKAIMRSHLKQQASLEDESQSISRSYSSSNSSEDDILTSLGVMHEDDLRQEETKWSEGLVRQSRHFVADRFNCSSRALMDDESTVASKDSTLFSNDDDDIRYAGGRDQAEI